eukprot:scpid78816/ scgid24658/ 
MPLKSRKPLTKCTLCSEETFFQTTHPGESSASVQPSSAELLRSWRSSSWKSASEKGFPAAACADSSAILQSLSAENGFALYDLHAVCSQYTYRTELVQCSLALSYFSPVFP